MSQPDAENVLDEGAGLDSEENCYDSLEDVKKRNSSRRLLPDLPAVPPASLPSLSGNTSNICHSDTEHFSKGPSGGNLPLQISVSSLHNV